MKIIPYKTIDSTNDEAKRLLASDFSAHLETILIAAEQTGGRGRQNRVWVSPVGNLFMSVITKAVDPQQLSQFALLWGVVMARSITYYTDALVQCKWPNDVLIEGCKVSGVLIEHFEGALIVGVGVNIHSCPSEVQFPATSMVQHTDKAIDPEDFARIIWGNYQDCYAEWQQKGFECIREAWINAAWKIHEQINIRQDDGYVVGIFETIDNSGALILKDATGDVTKLYVGDLI